MIFIDLLNCLFNSIASIFNGFIDVVADFMEFILSSPFLLIPFLLLLCASGFTVFRRFIKDSEVSINSDCDVNVQSEQPEQTWHCKYCDGINDVENENCPRCGAIRDKDNK